jgi:hypothetical protein
MNPDPRLSDTWLTYATRMAFYSLAVFCFPFMGKNAPIFSGQRMNQPSVVILTHLGVLAFLLSMLLASYIYLWLPNRSASELFRGRAASYSASGIMHFLFVFALIVVERRFIHPESGKIDSDSKNDPY